MISLYVLTLNLLSDVWFSNIFSHCKRCFYSVLPFFPLYCAEPLQFYVVSFVSCCFCFMYFGSHIQQIIAKINIKKIFTYISIFKSFTEWNLPLKSLINLSISMCSIRSNFVLLNAYIQFLWYQLLKIPSFVDCILLTSLLRTR